MNKFKIQEFHHTRIATIDVCSVGNTKNHVAALIEVDITNSRKKIRKYKNEINRISFTAWLLKVVNLTIKNH